MFRDVSSFWKVKIGRSLTFPPILRSKRGRSWVHPTLCYCCSRVLWLELQTIQRFSKLWRRPLLLQSVRYIEYVSTVHIQYTICMYNTYTTHIVNILKDWVEGLPGYIKSSTSSHSQKVASSLFYGDRKCFLILWIRKKHRFREWPGHFYLWCRVVKVCFALLSFQSIPILTIEYLSDKWTNEPFIMPSA